MTFSLFVAFKSHIHGNFIYHGSKEYIQDGGAHTVNHTFQGQYTVTSNDFKN